MNEIQGESALIIGYGREGKSVEAWLHKHYPSLRIGVTDAKDGDQYLQTLHEYDTVIRSPGVSPYLPEIAAFVRQGGHVTSATNIFFSHVPGMVIGVTGTKGKSTTASLITHILSAHYPDVRLVGNIGIPMLDHLEGASKSTIFVAELSSHQLTDIRYSPHIAALLPIVPEHQDYYPDLETYAAAKANITKFQTAEDIIIYDTSNSRLAHIAHTSLAQKRPYTSQKQIDGAYAWMEGNVVMSLQGAVIDRSAIALQGNAHSLLAATVVSHSMNVTDSDIGEALRTFTPLPHRLEPVGDYDGVRYINDSLSTIPEAAVHALDALGPDVATLIAGGFDRGLSYDVLGKRLLSSLVQTLILFPDTGKKIKNAVIQADAHHLSHITYYDVHTMEEAVKLAKTHTPKGKICLLSPASASFNLFRDYADRGEQFKEWVKK